MNNNVVDPSLFALPILYEGAIYMNYNFFDRFLEINDLFCLYIYNCVGFSLLGEVIIQSSTLSSSLISIIITNFSSSCLGNVIGLQILGNIEISNLTSSFKFYN